IGVAGLVGGLFVGLFVGVISGIFRVYMGGADAQVYLISSIFIGIIAGYFGLQAQRRKRYPSIAKSAMIGIVMEMIQMLSILTFSHDKAYAVDLISLIALPMIIVNSVGTAIFMSII
ncbi:sensor histidine kinase, partial [Escherichia coli]|nr:sensor histidine kinase [Escherichia coli]